MGEEVNPASTSPSAGGGWIVVVEGNFASFGSAKLARRQGLRVEVLTREPAWYGAHLPPIPAVDRVTVVDTLDAEAMVRAVRDGRVIAGVVCTTDAYLESAARLAEALRLPGPPPAAARRAARKDECRQRLTDHGFRQPRHVLVTDPDGPLELDFPPPYIVKPVNDSGSRGVTRCADAGEVRQTLRALSEVERSFFGAPLERRWLVESFVDGPEFSAELVYNAGAWRLLGFTQKRLKGFIESGHRFPARLPASVDPELVRDRVVGWLDAIGAAFGFAHVEFRLADGEPMLIEVNPRVGGGRIPTLIHHVLGVDPMDLILRAALGAEEPLGALAPRGSAAVGFVIPPHPGTVVAIDGLERAAAAPGVLSAHLNALPRTFTSVDSNADRMGYVIAAAEVGGDPFVAVDEALGTLELRWAPEAPHPGGPGVAPPRPSP